ncbi:MAG: DnaJ domain-containing protein [Cycloclasticus sp.]|nr:DnaJ domain-containing protein [Cycloclasticus sp.]MBQ0790310.1 DnaJ domain-containing protein [Cycloclasticus sp.]
MDFKDYYSIMGVKRDATQDEIKRAYRKLARKYHPDINKESDAEARFKEVGEAYEALKDPEKRAAYDQLGANWKAGQDFNPPPNWDEGYEFSGAGNGHAGGADHSDFFESLFGQHFKQGPQGRSQADFNARGQDHHAKVSIELIDAYQGATRSITLSSPELDQNGHLVTKQRTLNVKIPKGVKQGQRIRLAGQGGVGYGQGKKGDLYLEIEFKADPVYRVDGHDVYLDLPITPWEAALGATIKVPTPNGQVDLKIPAGTQGGGRMRLKARGIPGTPAGDLYVVPKITLPAADSDEAKQLYRQMEQTLAYNPRNKLGV